MNFTEEQMLAITKDNTSIIVSAGAGSGKTAVLSERVIDKINKGIHVDELLILTFTNKAALEMKERIEKKIRKLGNEEELKRLDKAYITTFDAFCLSIVKKYHYKKNISQNLTIIDSSFMDLKRNELIDEILEEKYREKDQRFSNLINNFCGKDDKNIKEAIILFLNNISLKIDKEEYLNTYIENHYSEEYLTKLIKELQELKQLKIENINQILDEIKLYDTGNFYEKTLDLVNKFIEENIKIDRLPNIPKEVAEEVKNLKDNLKQELKEIEEINEYLDSGLDDYLKTKEVQEEIIDILKKLTHKLDNYKKENDIYEFIDIELLACSLVQDKEIKEELKHIFKEIMIDEYQDTSDIQEYFINQIENNNVYMVGDIKQSIYRFRNANPDIFKNKYNLYKEGKHGFKIDLNKNFRSRDEVIDSINKIFDKLMDINYGGADYAKEHRLVFGNKMYLENKKETNKPVILTYADTVNKEEKEARIIATDIINKINNNYKIVDKETNKLRSIAYKDFAILLDRVSYTDTYMKVFEEYKIPLHVIKDTSILENNLLRIIKNVITFILTDDIELNNYLRVSILRSFIFELADDEILSLKDSYYQYSDLEDLKKQIRNNIDNLTPYLFIKEIINKFKIEEKLVKIGNIKENLEIIKYVYNIAETLELLGYTPYELKDYLEKISDLKFDLKLKATESENNSVNLMTIHKSKGLEFQVCYFAGLYKKFNISDLKETFTYHNDYGIITPLYSDGIKETFIKKLLKNKYLKEEISEKIRLFYVALTIAKETLIFVTKNLEENQKTKDKFNSFYDFLLSVRPDIEEWIEEAKIEEIPINSENAIEKNDKLITKDIEIIKNNPKEKQTYSKKVNTLITKEQKQNIEFGLNIHELLENTNLKEKSDNKYIKKLQENPLFKDIKNAKIYQEYEFYYEEDTKHNGIIDLMLEYIDHIDIIDYKLKNIEAEAYIKQLEGYRTYIKRKTNKPVNLYLYSIIDGSTKKL